MPTFVKIQGWAEQGGSVVIVSGMSSVPIDFQKSFPGCTVSIYLTGTATLASLFTDSTGVTPKANPFAAATDASWFAYIAPGSYDITFSGTGITTPFTISAVLVGVVLPTDVAYTDVANVFTVSPQTITIASNAGTAAWSTSISSIAASLTSKGSTVAGSQGTGGPVNASLSTLTSSSPNLSVWQTGSDGTIYLGTNDTVRALLSSSSLRLKQPLQLDGATSGAIQHRAQAIAGSYQFDWPNTDPTTGYNLYVSSFSGGVVTLSYQNPSPAASADPAGIPAMLIGVSSPSQEVLFYVANYSFNLPLTGSTALAKVAATAATDFDIRVNGISKGTMHFGIGDTIGTLTFATSSGISSGDSIEIIGPLVPDVTLANIAFNLKGSVTVIAATPVGLATMLVGLTTPTQQVYEYVANSSFTLAVTGSTGLAKIAATAQTDFLVKVNSVTKGTLRFAASGTVASVVSPTSTAIVSGDLIEIFGPATPDLTLSTIAFNLKGAT